MEHQDLHPVDTLQVVEEEEYIVMEVLDLADLVEVELVVVELHLELEQQLKELQILEVVVAVEHILHKQELLEEQVVPESL
jgi:hypothetical protein